MDGRKVVLIMLEARKRTALDGKSYWCVFDTYNNKWSTLVCFEKYKTKKTCQFFIDKWTENNYFNKSKRRF